MTDRAVTLDVVMGLHAVYETMGKNVEWLTDDDRARTGTVRGFRAEDGSDGYVRTGQDLRDTWVRITTTDGTEVWVPTMELAVKLRTGYARVVR